MDVSRKTEIRVGIVSISAILILIIGIMLGEGLSWSSSMYQVRFKLPSSGGLEPGSPIVVHGVKRGQVDKVTNHGGSVLVVGQVDDISDLYSDASAIVSMLEITGGKKIEIKPGLLRTPFDPKQEIPGTVSADIGSLISTVGEVSENAIVIIRRLDTLSAALTELTRDGTFITNVKSVASDGAILVQDARQWMQTNKGELTGMVKDLKHISSVVRESLDRNEPKISNMIDHLDRTLSSMDQTLSKADAAIVSVDSLVLQVNNLITEVKGNKSLLNRMVYDEQFAKEVDSTLFIVKYLLSRVNRDGVNINVGIGHR
ncbi:MAG: MlaD family protein [Ignavibacteria bacterium]